MTQARILIIEDDIDINNIIAARLSKDGHACTQAWSGSEAALRLESATFDLIITDLMLPGLTGENLVELVRAHSATVPVMVVSARVTPADKVRLFKQGVDDYLTKPFDLDELALRVEVQLRHRAQAGKTGAKLGAGTGTGTNAEAGLGTHSRALTRFGTWEVDSDARTLRANGKLIDLTRIEFNIVELLAKHPRKVFTKRELFELAWNEPYSVEDNTVNVHMSRIRSKLKDSGTDAYLHTVWGLGFKLIDPAEV